LWSAIPGEATLERVETRDGDVVVVYLWLPREALDGLDLVTFERIVRQVGGTLEPLAWRDVRIQVWDARAGTFVPLAAFLPETPDLQKARGPADDIELDGSPEYTGQSPSVDQGRPLGALSGKTIYVSAGHGWQWNGAAWRTQRPPYPTSPYDGPIIEDHNNAEAVNQYLLRYLWNAGATVIPVRERDMNSVAVIVDDDGPASGTGYSETGVWTTTSQPGTGYAGGHYRYATTVTGTATATAAWTATLPATGEYAVYAWYRQGANRAPDARYTVHHAGGETLVAVNQQVHGDTWHYLGTFGFLVGEEARVTLDNQSGTTGLAVIADAVRFGGGTFDDLTGIDTTASYPSGDPWWEVATFYYAQHMGMAQPPNDVTARPIYARWEHTGTYEDAVYVSWHSNGFSGYQWSASGTESYVHNGEWFPRTAGSTELQAAVHDELINDLRAGWNPAWIDRGKKQSNLGEVRELWDDEDAYARMPGVLLEVAFHDHPDDTDALKEPDFNLLSARAVYQGIVRYFEERDGIDLQLLPEPPTHLVVQNVGSGAVRVSWQVPPTDAVGLVGDAAAGYRVYTSTNGIGWSNGVDVSGTVAYTLTNLTPGQHLFVRVTATNAGGESLPTEVLAVCVGSADILIVSGFDRLDRSMVVSEVDPREGANERILLERMNARNYAIQHGSVISGAFDSASNEAVKDGVVGLEDYVIVDWIVGEESVSDETLDAVERGLLGMYLDDGGALFISGAEIGWHLDFVGHDPGFYHTYLRAEYNGDDAGTYQVSSVSGSLFDGLSSFRFDAAGMYDPDYPDVIQPLDGAEPALAYQGGTGGFAALQYANGCERLVYFGFPFETISPASRADVMGRVLDFLDECLSVTVETWITSPPDGGVFNGMPVFQGMADASAGTIDSVEVQVEHDGAYWTGSDWGSETWLAASDTAPWSFKLPPAPSDGEYVLRARAWTDGAQVDASPAEVAFIRDATAPDAATLITPTAGVTVWTPSGVTLEWETVGPGGGAAIAYVVQFDGQVVYTTTQTFYTVAQVSEGPHTWGVRVIDAAGNTSDWASEAFSVGRYTTWLPLAIEFKAGPACADLVVNGGFESDEGWTLNNLAIYTADQVQSGVRSARVGIPPDGAGQYDYSSVVQVVPLTVGGSATLDLWVYSVGEGGDAGDYHYIGILDEAGVYHALDHWQSDARVWEQRQYSLSIYMGQTVTLYIGTKNDGDDDTAALYIDGVRVEMCP
jgi:N-acetylmuramoyl-L-alanine amidase